MRKRRAANVLIAHADALMGRSEAMHRLEITDAERAQLAPLFRVTDRLRDTMIPVSPSAAFVRSLGKELANTAKHQIAITRRMRRGVLIGAAAVGSLVSIASIVGAIVLVVMRLRARAHARAAHIPMG
jgi:hypothetical protein